MFLVVVVLMAVAAGAWSAQYTRNSTYWLTAAGVMVPLGAGLLSFVKRASDQHLGDHLNDAADTLARTVKQQWLNEVGHKLTQPPLDVPFGVTEGTREIMDSCGGSGRKSKALRLHGTSANVADVFSQDDIPPTLVVLGEPGSGKSVIAQMLTIKMLELREEQQWLGEQRSLKQWIVPVCFPVAGWNPKKDDLDAWVAGQIAEAYPSLAEIIQSGDGTERTLASELVAARRILVVLDGLDEMPRKYQTAAMNKLSAAVKEKHCLVVTCRTKTYRRITGKSGPLPQTPVVELSPLSASAVRAHFQGTREPGQWRSLIRHLKDHPHGVLAQTLSSPLAIWLVGTVYHKRGDDVVELFGQGSRDEIMQHLLGGLVHAVYTTKVAKGYPKRSKRQAREALQTLTYLARNSGGRGTKTGKRVKGKKVQDIAWWQLHEKAPKTVIGVSVGFIVGSVLGVAVGIAVSIKTGMHAGVIYGGSFAVVTGVLSGITCVRPQPSPRLVNLKFISWKGLPKRLAGCLSVGLAVGLAFGYAANHGGGLRTGLIVAAVVGPVCAAAASPMFGLAPGITAGITASLALGLAAGLEDGKPTGAVAGPVAGLVFMASSWVWIGIYQTAEAETAPSPSGLLQSDRNGCLVVGATAGAAFGVVYGLALGPLVGGIAVAALFIAVLITVSLWGTFSIARVWLALHEHLPLRIMGFLHEAHARGLLRQVGGAYQFRHELLRRQLANPGVKRKGKERKDKTQHRTTDNGQPSYGKAPRQPASRPNGNGNDRKARVCAGAHNGNGNARSQSARLNGQGGAGKANARSPKVAAGAASANGRPGAGKPNARNGKTPAPADANGRDGTRKVSRSSGSRSGKVPAAP